MNCLNALRTRFTAPTVAGRLPRVLILTGAAASAASTFLAWTWTPDFPGDLSVSGYPGGNQLITLAVAVVLLLFAAGAAGTPGLRALTPAGSTHALRALALGLAASTVYTLTAIAVELHGLANWEPGAWVAAAAVLTSLVGAFLLPIDEREPSPARVMPRGIEIAALFVAMPMAMLLLNDGLATATTEAFLCYALAVGFGVKALNAAGLVARFSELTARHRGATGTATLFAAFLFVVVQTNDVYTTTADNVLIFGAAALGLNIVVGLTGLLDLGYVAFLGVGAYSAAQVSGSLYSRFTHDALPFWAAVPLGIGVALVAGVVIGAPTLRLEGDYLAIVTLGFGEIFRITANNLNGVSGPELTNGPNGVPGVPELKLFGYDFGQPHRVLGVTLGRFGNYYLLLLAVIAVIALIFVHVGDSRIGRAWVAIREDEKAASAMGINPFRLKLLAFALGASLAGLAGTVQAHVTTTVTPDQYQFSGTAPPNSAFLLAAVVLGGMGTIGGPLLGAALLYLVPEKLQFFQDKQLLLFAVTLIVMMRLRPEGLVANRRRRLEFHEEEITLAQGHETVEATA